MDGRRLRSEKTRRKILDGARRVFLERGPDGSSMKDLARASGVTQSLIHHHFGSKDALWEAVQADALDQMLEAMRPRLSRVFRQGGPELIGGLMDCYGDYLGAHPEMVRLLGWMNLARRGEPLPGKPGQAAAALTGLCQAQQAGTLRDDIDPAWIQVLLWILTEGWFLNKQQYGHRLGLDFSGRPADRGFLDAIARLLGPVLTRTKTEG
ncbi:MAG: TetR/AcrR family transcriptional regulator [Opitutales bacterium]